MSIQKANKNEVRKEIADLINRIKEQSDRIGTQREIPQSELDLILHRIEELHRRTVVWSYLNELPEEVSQFSAHGSPSSVQNASESVSQTEALKPVEPPQVSPLPKAAEEVKPPAPPVAAPPKVMEEEKLPVPPVVEPPKVVEEVKPPAAPVVEPPKVVEEKKQVQAPLENSKQDAAITKPVTGNLKDIKTFIGFNEKIMYIRQVFKGDNEAYDAAIAQFNSMNSWDEAQAFLSVLAGEYKWGQHDEPVEIFTQTVKRRFS
jgi:hypothetical protein